MSRSTILSTQEPGLHAPEDSTRDPASAAAASGDAPDDAPRSEPAAEYAARIAAREEEVSRLFRQEKRMEGARLASFAVLVVLVGLGRWGARAGLLASDAAALPAGAAILLFVGAVIVHLRRRRARRRCERAAEHYRGRLARVELRFAGKGDGGARFLPDAKAAAAHPYAYHLDLFGEGSIFEWLSDSRSEAGRQTLATWMLSPPGPAETRKRQEAVRELAPRLEIREARHLLEEVPGESLGLEETAAWARGVAGFRLPRDAVIAGALTLLTVTALAVGLFTRLGFVPLLAVLVPQTAFAVRWSRRVRAVVAGAERPVREIRRVAGILALVARSGSTDGPNRFVTGKLRELLDGLPEDPAGLERLLSTPYRLLVRRDWMGNAMFVPIGGLLLWGTHHAFAIERWRSRYGARVEAWQRAAGEFEALLDLSAYAWEHPQDGFPEIAGGEARFEAEGLCHPLLSEETGVRNDVRLGGPGEPHVLCVTGANMSGKSTLLRAVGVAIVLGRAGAPVRARRVRMGPLQAAASIRNEDSLLQARSHFYAELEALRTIVETAHGPEPVLFLMDEIMGGTDSGDRAVGVAGLLGELLERGAVGILTTHDRRLAEELEDRYRERLRNVHLAWRWKEGRLDFPYRLEPGLNPSANAIELMRSMGLRVERPA